MPSWSCAASAIDARTVPGGPGAGGLDAPPLRLFVSAGEVSGDRYGAGLITALGRAAAAAGRRLEVRALGGPRMAEAGARLIADTAARTAVGFIEPLRYLLPSLLTAARVRRLLTGWRPHAAVLIDYPGFNIPLSGVLKRVGGFPLVYYLPPEECIWGKKGRQRLDRAHQVCARAELVLTTHGQDTAFYRAQGCRVERIGHPLLDGLGTIPRERARAAVAPGHAGRLVALFPASRRLELRLLWPLMAGVAAELGRVRADLRFVVPVAGAHLRFALERALSWAARKYPELAGRLTLLGESAGGEGPSDLALAAADLAIAKAGSVTLELGLRGVPQVMVYRVDRITEWIGRRLLGLSERDFEHMALPNFILGEAVVPEFKQHQADGERIATLALELLDNRGSARADQLRGLSRLREVLGGPGAAERGARAILALIQREDPGAFSAAPTASASPDEAVG